MEKPKKPKIEEQTVEDPEESFLRCVFCEHGTIWQHGKTLELHITCGRKSELVLWMEYVVIPTFEKDGLVNNYDMKQLRESPILTNEEIQLVHTKGCPSYKRKRLVCDQCHEIIEPEDDWFRRGNETYHKTCMDEYVKEIDMFLDDGEREALEKNEAKLKQKESDSYQDEVDKLN